MFPRCTATPKRLETNGLSYAPARSILSDRDRAPEHSHRQLELLAVSAQAREEAAVPDLEIEIFDRLQGARLELEVLSSGSRELGEPAERLIAHGEELTLRDLPRGERRKLPVLPLRFRKIPPHRRDPSPR